MKKLYCFFLISIFCSHSFSQNPGFVQSAGTKIYYRTFGKDTPLLIINGGPGMNSDGFVNLAIVLSNHNQTIIYDQRGTGRSFLQKIDASTITMQLMVEDMENLRKHLQIKKWIILGHSFGGMLASYYATLHPENIISLILSSSGGIDPELLSYLDNNVNSKLTSQQSDTVNYWTGKINNGDTTYLAKWQRAKALAPAYVYDRKNIPVIAERLTQGNPKINNLIWQDMQKIKYNCAGKLSSFQTPVLIIQGKQDIVEEKTAWKAHRILKNATVVLLDKCVHYGWLDRKEEYLSEVEKFVLAN